METKELEVEIPIGVKIRSLRHELKLSQQALVGDRYSKTYLSKVECSQLDPSDELLAFLAERLGLSTATLVIGTNLAHAVPKRASRKSQELELTNAHRALQTGQPQEALAFLEKLNIEHLPPDLLAVYYATLGETEVELHDFTVGIADLEQALKLFQGNSRATVLDIERVRNWIGLAFYRQDKHFTALEYHRQCLKAINDGLIDDGRFKLNIYYNLANEYLNTGEKKEALELYQQAVELAEKGENNAELAEIYWGIGRAYYNNEMLDRAKLYLGKSASLYEKLGKPEQAATVKNVLGQTLTKRKEYKEAKKTLKSAIEISQGSQDERGLCIGYLNLAHLEYNEQKLAKAVNNAELAIKSSQQIEDRRLLGQAYAQLADIKLAQKDLDGAVSLYQQAVDTLEQTDALDYRAKVYFRFAAMLEQTNQMRESVQMYRKAYEAQRQLS